jgi:predicted metalloprotease with PDZ domain
MSRVARRAMLVAVLCLAAAAFARAEIDYQISLAHPEAHLFQVTMTVPNVRESVNVQLPAWNATYQIRDFAMRVQYVRATDEQGETWTPRKVDKVTWHISGSGRITLTYAILWDEVGPFASQLNTTHAFLNLAMILFYVPERRSENIALEIKDEPAGWRIATPLRAGSSDTSFVASSYDEMVDAPMECGTFQEFQLEGVDP